MISHRILRVRRKTTFVAVIRLFKFLDNQFELLQVHQPPVPVVGVAVGLASCTVGVGVMPDVGSAVGLEVAGIGVGVVPIVGFVAGTVGVVDGPTAGVVFVAAELVFWFCVLVFPVLKVALTATPFPSVVTTIGSGTFNKPKQFNPFAS